MQLMPIYHIFTPFTSVHLCYFSLSDNPTPAAPSQPPLTLGASLSFRKRMLMMRDAAAGIAHLHAQGYMHCDIKSLNFLVAEVRMPNFSVVHYHALVFSHQSQ